MGLYTEEETQYFRFSNKLLEVDPVQLLFKEFGSFRFRCYFKPKEN